MPRLAKPKPEHMATMFAIQAMKDTIKELRLRIGELQGTLPDQKTPTDRPEDRWIMNPLTRKKMFY